VQRHTLSSFRHCHYVPEMRNEKLRASHKLCDLEIHTALLTRCFHFSACCYVRIWKAFSFSLFLSVRTSVIYSIPFISVRLSFLVIFRTLPTVLSYLLCTSVCQYFVLSLFSTRFSAFRVHSFICLSPHQLLFEYASQWTAECSNVKITAHRS
jgi:hypothetical protein